MISPIRNQVFSPVWLYSAGVLLLFGMIIGQPAISLLAASVFVTTGLSWLWTRQALLGLTYDRYISESRAFRGETLTATFKLENRSWLPLSWVEIDEHVSDRVRPIDVDPLPSERVGSTTIRHTTPLRWKQRVTWTVSLQCEERGAHLAGPTTIRSGDPFGFFTRRMTIEHETPFLVYPDIVELPEARFAADFPFGSRRLPSHLLADPIHVIGVRDYSPDDSIRHMHWKASARLQQPQVKVFEPTADLQIGLFLNLDTFERYWEGMDSVRAESAILVAASLASTLQKQRAMVGIATNGVLSGSDQTLRVAPGRGSRQFESIMEGLARLSPMAVSSFPALLMDDGRRYPAGSSIAVIACIMTDQLELSIHSLVEHGQRVTLVRVGDIRVPRIPRLQVIDVAGDLSEQRRTSRHRYARMIRAGGNTHG
ncbi:MAG: DUF58 domain-containing protein [Thermomicrobiaceae bacterium]